MLHHHSQIFQVRYWLLQRCNPSPAVRQPSHPSFQNLNDLNCVKIVERITCHLTWNKSDIHCKFAFWKNHSWPTYQGHYQRRLRVEEGVGIERELLLCEEMLQWTEWFLFAVGKLWFWILRATELTSSRVRKKSVSRDSLAMRTWGCRSPPLDEVIPEPSARRREKVPFYRVMRGTKENRSLGPVSSTSPQDFIT